MPSGRVHLRASKMLLGQADPMVHKLLDLPTPVREHRYRHTPEMCRQIAKVLASGDQEQETKLYREAWLHVLMDWGVITETN